MRYFAAFLLALFIPVAALAAGADRTIATGAANSWLALVDSAHYDQSWKTASTLFKDNVTEAQWKAAAGAVRGPLGQIVARNVVGVDFATTLPGAPDGRYVVLTFDTKFANKAAAIETVAMVMEGGNWKTAGYHVR